MAGHTPNLGLWYPDGTDPISAGDDGIREITSHLDTGHGSVIPFPSIAARDAAIPVPENGMQCITVDTYQKWYGRAGLWAPTSNITTGFIDFGLMQLMVASAIRTTDANGYALIDWAPAFRALCLGAVASCGDSGSGGGWFVSVVASSVTPSSVMVRCITDSGVPATGTLRINIIAFGQ